MAYKNLVNVSCSSITEVFRHLKDWLIKRNGIADYSTAGLGWTLHDSSFAVDQDNPAANDWIVLYSAGEDGDQDLYLRITFVSLANGIITLRSGLYFNASTDAFVSSFPSAEATGSPTSGSVFTLYVYGDLSSFSVVIGDGSALYGRYFGLLDDTMHDPTSAVTAGAVTSGSSKVVTVDAVPSSWSVGKAVYIRDNAAIERAVISNISGSNVTLATLVNGYASGAKIARDYSVFISGSGDTFITYGNGQINRAGVVGGASVDISGTFDATLLSAADSDGMNDCHLTSYNYCYDNNPAAYYGRHRNVLRVSPTGITSGSGYADDETGDNWRALGITMGSAFPALFREV